jgi:hypothetical protein
MDKIESLLKSWRDRYCFMLANAEEAMFAGDEVGEDHWATCARQWRAAVAELEKVNEQPC